MTSNPPPDSDSDAHGPGRSAAADLMAVSTGRALVAAALRCDGEGMDVLLNCPDDIEDLREITRVALIMLAAAARALPHGHVDDVLKVIQILAQREAAEEAGE